VLKLELSEKKMMDAHLKNLANEREEALSEKTDLISEFSSFCNSHNLRLENKNFNYSFPIGIFAEKKRILNNLCHKLPVDKEGLVPFQFIREQGSLTVHMPGYIAMDNFIAMVHPYFRRSMESVNNFAPRIIDLLWEVNDPNIEAYIALDHDRVKVELEPFNYSESDTWFGAPFKKSIEKIPDGISQIRPPSDITSPYNRFFFNDAHMLDIKWNTKGNIKTFQSLEFKKKHVMIELDGISYHPVRYIHAEFDLSKKTFRHFDGAVQHFLPDEYKERIDKDFNFDNKSSKSIKAKSIKLFKFNGEFSVDFWVEFCSQFYTGNPLMFEYFSGDYPSTVNKALEKMRANVT
jgi:hypothetical protein